MMSKELTMAPTLPLAAGDAASRRVWVRTVLAVVGAAVVLAMLIFAGTRVDLRPISLDQFAEQTVLG